MPDRRAALSIAGAVLLLVGVLAAFYLTSISILSLQRAPVYAQSLQSLSVFGFEAGGSFSASFSALTTPGPLFVAVCSDAELNAIFNRFDTVNDACAGNATMMCASNAVLASSPNAATISGANLSA